MDGSRTVSRRGSCPMVAHQLQVRTLTSDLTISVGSTDYAAHKLVLHAYSGYFRDLFRRFGDQPLRVIELDGIDESGVFHPIYEFMYSGVMPQVERRHYEHVMWAAQMLDMPDVAEGMLEYLQRSNDVEMAASLRDAAEGTGWNQLADRVQSPMSSGMSNAVDASSAHKDEALQGIWIVGGSCIYRYIPEETAWEFKGHTPISWNNPGVVGLDGTLHVCGGIELNSETGQRTRISAAVWKFEPSMGDESWTQLASMRTPRVHHSSVTMNRKIYVIGGIDDENNLLDTVECYDRRTDSWSETSPMPFVRLGASACVHRGLVWLCGGFKNNGNDNDLEVTDTVQVYNPFNNAWYMVAPLRNPNAFCGIVTVGQRLFIVGGVNAGSSPTTSQDAKSISDVDEYDFTVDIWRHSTDMLLPRHCPTAVAIGEQIYVVGGMSSAVGEFLTTVERLDTRTMNWTVLSAQCPIGDGCALTLHVARAKL